jgi:hypothetical protein
VPGEIVDTTTQQNRRAFILIYHYLATLLGSPFGRAGERSETERADTADDVLLGFFYKADVPLLSV